MQHHYFVNIYFVYKLKNMHLKLCIAFTAKICYSIINVEYKQTVWVRYAKERVVYYAVAGMY